MSATALPEFGIKDASFQAAGGVDGIRRLVDDFYRIMDESEQASVVRRMHPGDLTNARDRLARFLCGWMGGPRLYNEKYGPISIPGVHSHLDIGEAERDSWLSCMQQAIDLQPYPAEFADYLMRQLRIPAERVLQVSKAARGK